MRFAVGQTVLFGWPGERKHAVVVEAVPGGPVVVDDLDFDGTPMQYETNRVPTYVLKVGDELVLNQRGQPGLWAEQDLEPA